MAIKKLMRDYTVSNVTIRSNDEAVAELTRELDVRRRLMDRWIAEGKLSYVEAHDRMERLCTAVSLIVNLCADDEIMLDRELANA